ncbi:hypothetical protein HOK51_05575 [Candidatus Woesearchaeota archaeon]|nr:hypothetical protein [Candidatus Woesearchaeota archaeon]MBT6519298.1 hypothetical protein [Candidatus Woesearchaeota archaeon]MBT7368951.1 hypothetical protein [Candidatus Woesearchaeota archaeon]
MFDLSTIMLYIFTFIVIVVFANALLKQWAPLNKISQGPGLVLFFIIVILVLFKPILDIVGFSIPFLALLVVALGLGALLYGPFGTKTLDVASFFTHPSTRTYVGVIVFIIFALGASLVFGQSLLEKGEIPISGNAVSFADVIMPDAPPPKTLDISPLFTESTLNLIFLFAIMGFSFVVVGIWMAK